MLLIVLETTYLSTRLTVLHDRTNSACELQPRVVRRCADEPEGEVVGVLPGHLSGQRAVLTSLGGEGQDAVSEGRLARDRRRRLARARGVPVEFAVVLDRQGDLRVLGRRGRPGPGQLPLDGRRGGRGRLGGRRLGGRRRAGTWR